MSIRNLQHLFAPRSVALIGASDRPGSLGATVLRNLLGAGFHGAIYPVNRRRAQVGGLRAYADLSMLPQVPDLAILCVPAAAVPPVVRQLGELGNRAAIVLSAGLAEGRDAFGRSR
jgi:acetyltransferase